MEISFRRASSTTVAPLRSRAAVSRRQPTEAEHKRAVAMRSRAAYSVLVHEDQRTLPMRGGTFSGTDEGRGFRIDRRRPRLCLCPRCRA